MKVSSISEKNLGRVIREFEIGGLKDLTSVICKSNYSLSRFSGKTRSKKSFLSSQFVALDIDEGLSIYNAKKIANLIGRDYIIAPTRNHQKDKSGKLEDRFRIIFELKSECNDPLSLVRKHKIFALMFPEADYACFDSARFYYPSKSVEYIKGHGGQSFIEETSASIETFKLSNDFIKNGCANGEWHNSVNKCVGYLIRHKFSLESIKLIIESVAIRKGNGTGLDAADISHIEDLYNRYSEAEESTCGIESKNKFLPSSSEIRNHLKSQREKRKIAQMKRLPFLDPIFDKVGMFLEPGLILIGNRSGGGKSTCVSNLVAEVLRRSNEKVLIITAEVDSEDYYSSVAANLLGINFFSYRKGAVDPLDAQKIEDKSESIVDRLNVIGHAQNSDIQSPKSVIQVMTEAIDNNYGLIVIDYYQRINSSDLDTIPTIKRFGGALNKFCSENMVPVVAMVQMKPFNERFPDEFSQRIQQDLHVFNHAHLAFDMKTNSESNTVDFTIEKSRFSQFVQKEITLTYKDGRLFFDPDQNSF